MRPIPPDSLEKIAEALADGRSHLDLSCSFAPKHLKLSMLPSEIFELADQLEALNLANNVLTSLPDSISKFKRLRWLNLSYNKLTDIPEVLARLENLIVLNLAGNPLNSFPDRLIHLTQLQELILGGTGITALPSTISNLANLRALNLFNNGLESLPETITKLSTLKHLSLGSNRLTEIPAVVYDLHDLESLELGNAPNTRFKNEIVELSSRIIELDRLAHLNLTGNPVTSPPPEVLAQGGDGIRNYYSQLEQQGIDYLYEAKLLIVGESGAGKTTLARKIENPNYQLVESETSTQGIEVITWCFPRDGGLSFRVNIWDFGGQEIYHSTHQFFLTKRSLYVLVADTRKEDTDFYYWLNVVQLLSNNSPLLIVKNEKQDRHREINERQLRGQFASLKETLSTNLATNRGLDEIVGEVKHHVGSLPHIGTPLPKTWVKVRAALEKDTRNYINLDEYLRVCERNGFTSLPDKLQLSGYLHDLGVCLHFQQDPLLRKTVILKPKWGTDAVYKVLDNKTVTTSLGRFNLEQLTTIWNEDQYATMQHELLQLMINFKLCYKIPQSEYYIAPQLLTANQPHYEWSHSDNLVLRYSYEFMPKGIITQFIVAMHMLIAEQKYVWRSGVLLERESSRAEIVEFYDKREIRVRVTGEHKTDLMTIVTYELDKIHLSYQGLRFSKLIPCNCPQCGISSDPHFYPLAVLRQFLDDMEERIQCQRSYRMVDVRKLIDDVIDPPNAVPNESIQSPLRNQVFISYSHSDNEWLNRLQLMLRPIVRNDRVCLWADTSIQPGSRWREEIQRALSAAKVAVLLVTPSFLASDFIAEHELPPLLHSAAKRGLKILWLAISDSLYKDTELAAYQAANDPTRPLDSLSSPEVNRELVKICEEIKRATNSITED